METIQGFMTNKEIVPGKAGAKEWIKTSFQIVGDSRYFSTFETVKFVDGDRVIMDFEKKGKYNNVKTIRALMNEGTHVKNPLQESPKGPTAEQQKNFREDKTKDIRLQNAGHVLSRVYAGKDLTPTQLAVMVKEYVTELYKEE